MPLRPVASPPTAVASEGPQVCTSSNLSCQTQTTMIKRGSVAVYTDGNIATHLGRWWFGVIARNAYGGRGSLVRMVRQTPPLLSSSDRSSPPPSPSPGEVGAQLLSIQKKPFVFVCWTVRQQGIQRLLCCDSRPSLG